MDVVAQPFAPYLGWIPLCPDTTMGEPYEGFVHQTALYITTWMGPAPHDLGPDFTATLYTTGSNDSAYHIAPVLDWPPSTSIGTIPFTDANGCAGEISYYVPDIPQYAQIQVLELDASCSGGANGRLRVQTVVPPSWCYPSISLMRSNGQFVSWQFIPDQGQFLNTDLAPGDYWIVQRYGPSQFIGPMGFLEQWFSGAACADSMMITVPDAGYTCGTLSGQVFVDSDEDCVLDAAEVRLPNEVLEIQPGNYYTASAGGQYSINLPYGTYTVSQPSTQFDQHCASGDMAFTLNMAFVNATRNMADTSLTGMDASIGISSGPARPGFQLPYALRIKNLTATNTGASTVTFTLDPAISFVSALPAPASVVGNAITWNLASLSAFQESTINVLCQVPPDVGLIGADIVSIANVNSLNADIALANNTAVHTVTVTGSFDPNDKLVQTTSGSEGLYLIDADDHLTYTIRFQNTGTDTAFFVVVVDTLASELDPATFEPVASSHPYALDLEGHGILRFMFANILLPDSNVNEAASHGFVSFRIRPVQPVLPGTQLTNTAHIFFDYNPAVVTEPSVLTAEFSTEVDHGSTGSPRQITVAPNPANDQLSISAPASIARVRVLSADGREVLQRSARSSKADLDVSGLPGGSYYIIAELNDGTIVRERFIKH